jgi:putative SOS response-associated peptidase YedK
MAPKRSYAYLEWKSQSGMPGRYHRNLQVWLGGEATDPSELKSLLTPFPSEQMTCWPVSVRVGNVKNNDPGLIEPIAA